MVVSTATGRKILIIDDSLDGADTLAEILKIMGHQVEVTLDGFSGVQVATTFQPDVVLLDLKMPGLDGFDVLRKLRRISQLRETRVVAFTAFADAVVKALVKDAGFDMLLSKPPSFDSILSAIEADKS